MRTTVNIDDHLLAWAKDYARERERTLGEVVDEALQRLLTAPVTDEGPELPVFQGGRGVMPGVDLDSNRSMFDALDDGGDLHA